MVVCGIRNYGGLSQSKAWKVTTAKYAEARYYHRYTYRVLQTIQMKLILLSVWAEWAVMGSAKTALKFKYEI